MIEDIFGKKAPVLPENIKKGVIEYFPTISVVLAVISSFAILAAIPLLLISLGVLSVFAGYSVPNTFEVFATLISLIVSVITIYLTFKAYPKLKNREKEGWKLWYQNVWVGVIGSPIQLNIIGALVNGAVGFYILMQVKSKYTK